MALPLLDEHSATVHASPDVVWRAVRQFARDLAQGDHAVLGPVLGPKPPSGFALAEEVEGERIALTGRHRFSDYRLVFELDAAGDTTRVSVLSFAAFPGARGRLYHALLIGTGGHVLAVRRMLRTIQRRVASP